MIDRKQYDLKKQNELLNSPLGGLFSDNSGFAGILGSLVNTFGSLNLNGMQNNGSSNH